MDSSNFTNFDLNEISQISQTFGETISHHDFTEALEKFELVQNDVKSILQLPIHTSSETIYPIELLGEWRTLEIDLDQTPTNIEIISDLHLFDRNASKKNIHILKSHLEKIFERNPDMLIINGDFLDASSMTNLPRTMQNWREIFDLFKLENEKGKRIVLTGGNHDEDIIKMAKAYCSNPNKFLNGNNDKTIFFPNETYQRIILKKQDQLVGIIEHGHLQQGAIGEDWLEVRPEIIVECIGDIPFHHLESKIAQQILRNLIHNSNGKNITVNLIQAELNIYIEKLEAVKNYLNNLGNDLGLEENMRLEVVINELEHFQNYVTELVNRENLDNNADLGKVRIKFKHGRVHPLIAQNANFTFGPLMSQVVGEYIPASRKLLDKLVIRSNQKLYLYSYLMNKISGCWNVFGHTHLPFPNEKQSNLKQIMFQGGPFWNNNKLFLNQRIIGYGQEFRTVSIRPENDYQPQLINLEKIIQENLEP